MSRAINRLSAMAVRSAKPGYHADGGGLYLQVTETSKSWVFRYERHKRRREMGLGPLRDVPMADARVAATAARRLLLAGLDPIEERNRAQLEAQAAAAAAMSFRQAAEACIADRVAGWKNEKHARQWRATLETYAYPHFGDLAVGTVDTPHILKALRPIWSTIPETAGRVRGRIENVLDWAKAEGLRAGENPARWKGHLAQVLPPRAKVQKVEHHPALAYGEIPAFMAALRQQEGAAALALELTILLATRTNETIGAREEEFDLDRALWTIPAGRMKAGVEHVIPLPPRAVAIVRAQLAVKRRGGFVFPGAAPGKAMSNMAMLMLLRRMGRDSLTVHGFRSTFKDWVSETTAFPPHVSEMALAHTIRDKVDAAYRRGQLLDHRRRLMEAWATYCATPAADAGGVVTPLRRS